LARSAPPNQQTPRSAMMAAFFYARCAASPLRGWLS
jgi:hypothetical protein